MTQTACEVPCDAKTARHFAFHYASWLLNPLKLIPGALERSGIDVDGQKVRVRMSPGGEIVIPRDDITHVWHTWAVEQGIVYWLRLPVGIHSNVRGTWWFNASSHSLVAIDIDPPACGRAWGMTIRPKRVVVSVEDPIGFIAEVLG